MEVVGDVLYVASFTNDKVLRVNKTSGELLGSFGNEEELDCPEGIAVAPDGTLFVTSFLKETIARYEPTSGKYLGAFGSKQIGSPPMPQLLGAEDVAIDWEGGVH